METVFSQHFEGAVGVPDAEDVAMRASAPNRPCRSLCSHNQTAVAKAAHLPYRAVLIVLADTHDPPWRAKLFDPACAAPCDKFNAVCGEENAAIIRKNHCLHRVGVTYEYTAQRRPPLPCYNIAVSRYHRPALAGWVEEWKASRDAIDILDLKTTQLFCTILLPRQWLKPVTSHLNHICKTLLQHAHCDSGIDIHLHFYTHTIHKVTLIVEDFELASIAFFRWSPGGGPLIFAPAAFSPAVLAFRSSEREGLKFNKLPYILDALYIVLDFLRE
jgi:hypothetical protein